MTALAAPSVKETLLLRPSRTQVDSILFVLDDVIAHKSDYQARRIAYADSLLSAATAKRGEQRVMAMKEAYVSYSHVSGSKSMAILDSIETLPEYQTDRSLRLWTLDSRGYIYSVMGMFHRSYDLLSNVNVQDYDRASRMHHYDTVYKILSWADQAFCNEKPLVPKEREMMKLCNDSLKNYATDPISIAFASVAHDIASHAYDSALQHLVTLYQQTEGQEETYVYAHLCDVFIGKKDTLALTYYFAKTSISDIKDGTTEYMCLPALVQYLYDSGDVDRAYNYLKCCLDDAYLYPSQYLISQTTNIFPIIDRQYQKNKSEVEASERNMMILAFFVALLFLVLVALSIVLHHRQQMMYELRDANNRLAETNERLAHANNVKTVFLQNITHELHTPMNAIDGFAQLLDSYDGQIDEPSRKEMTTAIRSSSHHLNMLIDNILMLTEYEDASVETKKDEVSISQLFEALSQEVYNSRKGTVDITFTNDIPADHTFLSSRVHLHTILLNLIDNSLIFTEQGSVNVHARLADDGSVVLSVTDTGCGIPDDKQSTVFDRFANINEFAQGAGLSLSLCHRLTTMLGGRICVDRSDSHGTSISVTIPR